MEPTTQFANGQQVEITGDVSGHNWPVGTRANLLGNQLTDSVNGAYWRILSDSLGITYIAEEDLSPC